MVDDNRLRRFAVLIDADNTSPRIAAGLFEEVAKFGEASVRRIYGDFSSTRLRSWADILQKYAIDPYQQFAYTSGKNASDIALVIDAMDLLHSRRFDGFCLVSSDSDFTRLASRLREEGADVYGFGAQKTPESFRQACRRFVYTENLLPEAAVTTVFTEVGTRWAEVTTANGRSLSSRTTTPASDITSPLTQVLAPPGLSRPLAAHPPTNRIRGAAAAEPMQNASSWPHVPSTSVIATWRSGSSSAAVSPSAASARPTASRPRASADLGSSVATPMPTRKPSPYRPSATAVRAPGIAPRAITPGVVLPTTGAPRPLHVSAAITAASSRQSANTNARRRSGPSRPSTRCAATSAAFAPVATTCRVMSLTLELEHIS